jgi:MSHA pilin protein MshA
LIELIVVIVILGILAATALPRFVNLQGEARSASMKGVAGSARAAAELIRGKWLAVGSSGSTSVDPGSGASVTVNASGFPVSTSAGIEAALNLSSGGYNFTHAGGLTSTIRPGTDTATTCTVVYTAATGSVDDSAATATNCN